MKKATTKTRIKNPFFSEEAVNSLSALIIIAVTIFLVVYAYTKLDGASISSTQMAFMLLAGVAILISFFAFIISLMPLLRFRKYRKILSNKRIKSLADFAEKEGINTKTLEFDIKNLSSTEQLLKESPNVANYASNKTLSGKIHFRFPEKEYALLLIQPAIIVNFAFVVSKAYEQAPLFAIIALAGVVGSFAYVMSILRDAYYYTNYKKKFEDKEFAKVSKEEESKLKKMIKKGYVIGLRIDKYSGRVILPVSSGKKE